MSKPPQIGRFCLGIAASLAAYDLSGYGFQVVGNGRSDSTSGLRTPFGAPVRYFSDQLNPVAGHASPSSDSYKDRAIVLSGSVTSQHRASSASTPNRSAVSMRPVAIPLPRWSWDTSIS